MIHGLARRLSLKWIFIIAFLMPLSLISIFLIILSFQLSGDEIRKHLEQQVELVARSLEYPISQALQAEDDKRIHKILRATDNIRRIYTIHLFDQEGKLLWTSDENKIPKDKTTTKESISNTKSKNKYTEINGQSVYSHFQPIITPKGNVIGLVQLTREKSNIKKEIAAGQRKIITIYAIATLLILLTLLITYNKFIRGPIENLAKQLFEFRLDNITINKYITVNGPNDFKVIEKAFNSLIEKLISYEKQINNEQTKQLELKDKIKQSEKLAAIGTLSAGVAHDLGNPLSAIDATVQRIERKDNISKGLEKYISHIKNETKRMEDIIRQLLNFTSSEKGENELVHLKDIVTDAKTSFLRLYPNTNITIKEADEFNKINVNKTKMIQVLVNLLTNAYEASINTNNEVKIHLTLKKDDHNYSIEIEDNGPGIIQEEKTKIFEPFYSKGIHKGPNNKGLGMAIVHGIIQSHGGEIQVMSSSTLGGAKFIISLPYQEKKQ